MAWANRSGIPLILTAVSLVSVAPAWSADKATKPAAVARPSASPTRSQTKTARPQVKPVKAAPSTAEKSAVTPASFHTVSDVQDSLSDTGEVIYQQNQGNVQRICHDSCFCRVHRFGSDVITTEHENCRDWFNYIRGYGPVIWVRNGPEWGCHPPSIPFAKRVGGATVRPWEGVTGIPYPPEISPRTVYLIRAEDLKYRFKN